MFSPAVKGGRSISTDTRERTFGIDAFLQQSPGRALGIPSTNSGAAAAAAPGDGRGAGVGDGRRRFTFDDASEADAGPRRGDRGSGAVPVGSVGTPAAASGGSGFVASSAPLADAGTGSYANSTSLGSGAVSSGAPAGGTNALTSAMATADGGVGSGAAGTGAGPAQGSKPRPHPTVIVPRQYPPRHPGRAVVFPKTHSTWGGEVEATGAAAAAASASPHTSPGSAHSDLSPAERLGSVEGLSPQQGFGSADLPLTYHSDRHGGGGTPSELSSADSPADYLALQARVAALQAYRGTRQLTPHSEPARMRRGLLGRLHMDRLTAGPSPYHGADLSDRSAPAGSRLSGLAAPPGLAASPAGGHTGRSAHSVDAARGGAGGGGGGGGGGTPAGGAAGDRAGSPFSPASGASTGISPAHSDGSPMSVTLGMPGTTLTSGSLAPGSGGLAPPSHGSVTYAGSGDYAATAGVHSHSAHPSLAHAHPHGHAAAAASVYAPGGYPGVAPPAPPAHHGTHYGRAAPPPAPTAPGMGYHDYDYMAHGGRMDRGPAARAPSAAPAAPASTAYAPYGTRVAGTGMGHHAMGVTPQQMALAQQMGVPVAQPMGMPVSAMRPPATRGVGMVGMMPLGTQVVMTPNGLMAFPMQLPAGYHMTMGVPESRSGYGEPGRPVGYGQAGGAPAAGYMGGRGPYGGAAAPAEEYYDPYGAPSDPYASKGHHGYGGHGGHGGHGTPAATYGGGGHPHGRGRHAGGRGRRGARNGGGSRSYPSGGDGSTSHHGGGGGRGRRGRSGRSNNHGGGSPHGGGGGSRRGGSAPNIHIAVDDLRGKVLPMSKDQNGCRLLQQQLDDGDRALLALVIEESTPHLIDMMVDPFGNYLFQKMIQHSDQATRLSLLKRVVGNGRDPSPLVSSSLGLHGTRSVQKIVSTCRTPEEVGMIVAAIKDDVVRLATDTNGNHVMQRCLQHMSAKNCQFIINSVRDNCLTLARQRHGCCVMQRCIDAGTEKQKEGLITVIVSHALVLMQDPFGNYVIQYVLSKGTFGQAKALMKHLVGHMSHLSTQKFSSNVVEKCLQRADDDLRAQLVDEICEPETISALCLDQYGNYVVQQAVSSANTTQGTALVTALRPHVAVLESTSGGRRIIAKLTKKFPEMWLP